MLSPDYFEKWTNLLLLHVLHWYFIYMLPGSKAKQFPEYLDAMFSSLFITENRTAADLDATYKILFQSLFWIIL